MEAGLGQLGFWLMLGMIFAAMIVSEALKEREKQATLRALLEKDGQSATEVLAYMRERDAAKADEAARERAWWGRICAWWGGIWRRVAVAVLAFAGGIFVFGALRFGLLRGSESALIPVVAMLGVWGAGLLITLRMWRSAKRKYDAHPGA